MRLRSIFLLTALAVVPGAWGSDSEAGSWPSCGSVDRFPGESWESPANPAPGWDARALADALAYLDSLESSGVMVLHRGRLVAQWGDVATPRMMASLRKSVLSGLLGTFSDTGLIDFRGTLAELGVDDSEPSLTEAERQATLVDLMSARSGIYHSAHYETGGWKRAKARMAANGSHAPGATWLYNNWDFNTLGSILEAQVGESMGDAFARRIAGPTRMQDFTPAAVSYVGDESYAERMQGNHSNFPAYMFEMSVRDLARFGLLYLNCGRWENAQVIPRRWVLESVKGRPVADGAPPGNEFFEHFGDYGYMWWVDKPGSRTWPAVHTKAPVYFGQGANGHFLWIAPYLDLVVVHQVATPGGLSTFDQLRRRFLGQPTVADNEFQEFLRRVLAAHPRDRDA